MGKMKYSVFVFYMIVASCQNLRLTQSVLKGPHTKIWIISLTAGDKLWWADQGTDQIGTCDKKDGGNWKILRNNTSPMMHMRIYDEDVQKGKEHYSACGIKSHISEADVKLTNISGRVNKWGMIKLFFSTISQFLFGPHKSPFPLAGINLCSNNNGDCSQLCLPTSPTTRACMCTAGYSLKTGQQSCEGKTLLHSYSHT